MDDEIAWHERPVVYTVAGMTAGFVKRGLVYKTVGEDQLRMDVYQPPSVAHAGLLPGVIFIHGGPISPTISLKDTGQFRSWGALAAAMGQIGITFNHRYDAPEMLLDSAADVKDAIAFVRRQAKALYLDADRICLWTCSGGGHLISFALSQQPGYVRCLVIYYARMDPGSIDSLSALFNVEALRQLSPMAHLGAGRIGFPIFVARAGRDDDTLNQTLDRFIERCLASNVAIEVMTHPDGGHAFDILDDDARSRQIIARTLSFIQENI